MSVKSNHELSNSDWVEATRPPVQTDAQINAAAIAIAGTPHTPGTFQLHIYSEYRCIFCNVNSLDDEIYGPFGCIERGQYVYTTETPGV
jgi:hypothetical protein